MEIITLSHKCFIVVSKVLFGIASVVNLITGKISLLTYPQAQTQ
jgi:hypothetical protein